MSAIVTVPFHGHNLITIEKDGKHHVAMKPIVEAIGLQWEAQLKRIKRNPVLSEGMSMMDTPSNGGMQQMAFIPLDYLNGWLFGIEANRVKPEIRDKVISYQRECYTALHDYWFKGVAVKPAKAGEKISHDQARTLQEAVANRCQGMNQKDKAAAFPKLWGAVKSSFRVPTYRELPSDQFDAALSLIARLPLTGEVLPAQAALPVQNYPHPCMKPDILKSDLGTIQESMENVAAHLQQMLFTLQKNANAIQFRRGFL